MRESLQSRRHGKHRSQDADIQETTKAAAWAVFQHRGGSLNRPTGLACGVVRRASRFKIEAQMNQEMAHHSASAPSADAAANNWDAGSTLFDSFELDSLCKQLGDSFHPQPVSSFDEEDEEPEYAASMDTGTDPSSLHHGYHDDEESEEYVEDGRRHSYFQQHASGRRKQLDLIDEVLPITIYGGPVSKDNATGRSASSHGKLLNAFSWWSMSKSRRRRSLEKKSSDDEESPKEAAQHKSKWKLSNIFHPSHHDVAHVLHSPKRIVPHEYSLEKGGHKAGRGHSTAKNIVSDSKFYNHPPKQEKSGYGTPRRELDYIAKDVDLPSGFDNREADFFDHDHDDHQQHFSHALKSGLRMVLPRSLCRPLHGFGDAGSDMDDVTVYHHTQPASNKGSRHHQHYYGDNIRNLHRHPDEEQEYSETDYHHDHHHHYHHHYVHQQAEEQQDYELTVQAIVRRVPRKSSEEMMVYKRLSIEESGVQAPRNSLENFERRNSWENHYSRGS